MNLRDALAADPDTLVRTDDVVALTGRTRQMVHHWVRTGRLPAVQDGPRRPRCYRLGDVLPLVPPPARNRFAPISAVIAACAEEITEQGGAP